VAVALHCFKSFSKEKQIKLVKDLLFRINEAADRSPLLMFAEASKSAKAAIKKL
jgi:hypothetical protein